MSGDVLGVGLIGCGTVGGGVVKLLRDEVALYTQRTGRRIALRRVLVRNPAKACKSAGLAKSLVTSDPAAFFATPDVHVVIEVAGGLDPIGNYVRQALSGGKHVITANKSLLARHGAELFALARKHNVAIAFEAACAGGIPIITALQFGLMANRIHALYGILNGTCNYILTEMTQHAKPYADALREAQEKGFAEADPTLDVSGRDAAQKLAVLANLAFGIRATDEQVWSEGIDNLALEDIELGAELGYEMKLLGIAEHLPADKKSTSGDARYSLRVHPSFISSSSALAQVHGSFNAISVYGHANGHTFYSGRGAGQLPTASAVVSDLLNIASNWYPQAFAQMNLWCDRHEKMEPVPAAELRSRFYLRINALDVPGVMAKVSRILGEAHISLSAILQHEANAGEFVPVVITTHAARQGDLNKAITRIRNLSVIRGEPVVIRIVDTPAG